MTVIDREHFYDLLLALSANRSEDFVGLGVIVYSAFQGLPVISLGTDASSPPTLPVRGEKDVMSMLSILATRQSEHHDGFHLINAETGDLTHLAQFVSPPLDAAHRNPLVHTVNGARQMTALLASTMPQVEFTAIVTAEGDVQFYCGGTQALTRRTRE